MEIPDKLYVQRDLEDQIKEEMLARWEEESKSNNFSNLKQGNMSQEQKPEVQRKSIDVDEVISLIKQGYSRYKKVDKGFGSIQEKYELTGAQVKQLFNYPRLKGIKTKFPDIEIVDKNPPVQIVDSQAGANTAQAEPVADKGLFS